MALRASAKNAGDKIDLRVVLGENPDQCGIANAATLTAFVETFMVHDKAALAAVRDALITEMGAEAMVDTAAVTANFQRMTRIADATGIPLDEQMHQMTQDIQQKLGLKRFPSARNTLQ